MNAYSNKIYRLPNGHSIYHQNSYETDYVFNEIFNENIYLQHGIEINDNAVIFDVGANIGLFSLYIKQNYHTSKIYAFEPSSDIFQILELNLSLFGNSIKTYNIGLSDDNKDSVFYYYPEFSVISGFHANQERDAEIIISGINEDDSGHDFDIKNLIYKRLTKMIPYSCQLSTISRFIAQEQISTIDLLKLDVEGSELAILNGISENDWPMIKQIVMEVHSKNDLEIIGNMLKRNLFTITIEVDKRLKNAGIYNLYARR